MSTRHCSLKMAYETHYVGDLRAINYAILDQYQVRTVGYSLVY